MSDVDQRRARFLELHVPGAPLLMPNPWDAGSARMLASLGFEAVATTSSGFAISTGRLDYGVTRDDALSNATAIVEAVHVPVSGDLENGFGDDPDAVAETVRGALAVGLAGCSIEDYSPGRDAIYDLDLAVARVAAAAEIAHAGDDHLVLTARAENLLHGRDDLRDTIARLEAYRDAGADVVYAPGLTATDDIHAVVEAVGIPVNVLALKDVPPVAELAALGVARVSVGGHFAHAALAALVDAAQELRDLGTYAFTEPSARGARATRQAFG